MPRRRCKAKPKKSKRLKKRAANACEDIIFSGLRIQGSRFRARAWRWTNVESNTKEHGKLNTDWDYWFYQSQMNMQRVPWQPAAQGSRVWILSCRSMAEESDDRVGDVWGSHKGFW